MANIWKQFEDLLEKDTTQVATVLNTDGQRSQVELLSGEVFRVTGTAEPGSRVYIKGQRIEAAAPNMPAFNLILY